MNLPRPTEEELQRGNKSEYFARLLEEESVIERNLDSEDLTRWIHSNYDSILLSGNEITFKEYKKKTK